LKWCSQAQGALDVPTDPAESGAVLDLAGRARRHSLRKIADSLNRDQVPTAQAGKQWYAATVRSILTRTARAD
jgi:Recombinase